MSLLPDIQNTQDTRGISIDEVGVRNIKFPLILKEKNTDDNSNNPPIQTVANIDLTVSLDKNEKGTHMSRFLILLNSEEFRELDCNEKLEIFLTRMNKNLNSEMAFFNATFPIFRTKLSPVQHVSGLIDYDCVLRAVKSKEGEFERILGIKVNVNSCCPCSKEISKYGAHNQRSTINIYVRPKDNLGVNLYYDLVDICESNASCELYPILKREDEKHVTERAYENPKFVEDIVRDVALSLANNKDILWFSVTSTNYESIHNHDAFARIERGNKSKLLDPPML